MGDDIGMTPAPQGGSAATASRSEAALENFTTVVFHHANEAQRQELMAFVHTKWNVEGGLRVTALSCDHEMTRLGLIEEALDRIDDDYDLREIIGEICTHPDVSAWDWEKALEDG